MGSLIHRILSFISITAFVLSLPCADLLAQDPLSVKPGSTESGAGIEKARARHEYFYNRLTYPNGTIPTGARARAWKEVRETMVVYTPGLKKGTPVVAEWKNVGPFNIGGRIFGLAINPKNPNTMFIGAADGGVWRSWDGAHTWHSVSGSFPTQSMGTIVINPKDTNVVYAGTGDASFGGRSFDGAGMFKSTDGGDTWTEDIFSGLKSPFFYFFPSANCFFPVRY